MAEADPGPLASLRRIDELSVGDASQLDTCLKQADRPFVVRGLAAGWPLVEAGRRSARDARDYLLQRARNAQFTVSVGARGAGDRLFYDEAMQMNFRIARARLSDIFAQFDAAEQTGEERTLYLAS